jgi:hypothetical protein
MRLIWIPLKKKKKKELENISSIRRKFLSKKKKKEQKKLIIVANPNYKFKLISIKKIILLPFMKGDIYPHKRIKGRGFELVTSASLDVISAD